MHEPLSYCTIISVDIPQNWKAKIYLTDLLPDAVKTQYLGLETTCSSWDGRTRYVCHMWAATLTQDQIEHVWRDTWWEYQGESGGILSPPAFPDTLAPSVIYSHDCGDGAELKLAICPYPADARPDYDFAAWDDIIAAVEVRFAAVRSEEETAWRQKSGAAPFAPRGDGRPRPPDAHRKSPIDATRLVPRAWASGNRADCVLAGTAERRRDVPTRHCRRIDADW